MILAFCKLNEDSVNITNKLAEQLQIEFKCNLNDYNRSGFYIALMLDNLNLRFTIYAPWEIEMFRYKCIPILELINYEPYVRRMHESFLSYKIGLQILKQTRENLIAELKDI